MTIQEFIEANGLTIETVYVGPELQDWFGEPFKSGYVGDAKNIDAPNKWMVTIRRKDSDRVFTTEFTLGAAHRMKRIYDESTNTSRWERYLEMFSKVRTISDVERIRTKTKPAPPDLEMVLNHYGLEGSVMFDTLSFEEWAMNTGYDPDSRRAERIYRAIGEKLFELRKLLGYDAYNTLCNDVERL
jgi:hypothetical protein